MFGTVLVWWMAAQSFFQVDELLKAEPGAEFAAAIDPLDASQIRPVLRYMAAELNRNFFRMWELIQLTLAAAVLALVYRRPPEDPLDRFVLAGMGLLVVLFLAYFTPELIQIGRVLDFAEGRTQTALHDRFTTFHRIYVAADVLKFGLGMWVSWRLIWKTPRSA